MKVRYSRVYRQHWTKKPYTYVRSKQGHSKNEISNKKLTSYTQGEIGKYSLHKGQIRITATQSLLYTEVSLEAFRITLSRLLARAYIKANWHYQICKHTHIILREHKLPHGGTVDRISMGMRLAYGVPFARAAKIHKGETLLILRYAKVCNPQVLKNILNKATSKLAKRLEIKNVIRK